MGTLRGSSPGSNQGLTLFPRVPLKDNDLSWGALAMEAVEREEFQNSALCFFTSSLSLCLYLFISLSLSPLSIFLSLSFSPSLSKVIITNNLQGLGEAWNSVKS